MKWSEKDSHQELTKRESLSLPWHENCAMLKSHDVDFLYFFLLSVLAIKNIRPFEIRSTSFPFYFIFILFQIFNDFHRVTNTKRWLRKSFWNFIFRDTKKCGSVHTLVVCYYLNRALQIKLGPIFQVRNENVKTADFEVSNLSMEQMRKINQAEWMTIS